MFFFNCFIIIDACFPLCLIFHYSALLSLTTFSPFSILFHHLFPFLYQSSLLSTLSSSSSNNLPLFITLVLPSLYYFTVPFVFHSFLAFPLLPQFITFSSSPFITLVFYQYSPLSPPSLFFFSNTSFMPCTSLLSPALTCSFSISLPVLSLYLLLLFFCLYHSSLPLPSLISFSNTSFIPCTAFLSLALTSSSSICLRVLKLSNFYNASNLPLPYESRTRWAITHSYRPPKSNI